MAEARKRRKKKRRLTKATNASAMKLSVPSFFASHFKRSSKKSSSRRSSSTGSTNLHLLLLPLPLPPRCCFPSLRPAALFLRLRARGRAAQLGPHRRLLRRRPHRGRARGAAGGALGRGGAFMVFDADGDGKISAEELRCVLETLGDEWCSLDNCRRMIHGIDTDGDGDDFVCFNDFARMMDDPRCF